MNYNWIAAIGSDCLRQHHPVLQQRLAWPQGLFRCAQRELGMVVELR